jgi:hypothetical protein
MPQHKSESSPAELTSERGKTHGDWMKQSNLARNLKAAINMAYPETGLYAYQEEALDMILVKVSRIVCGNPNEPDHWDDIAGYAYLGKGGHDQSD